MSIANIPFYLLTAVVFLAMISVLVAAHEYGHYLFARMFGMGVEEFAIGMGKKIKVWSRKQYDIPISESYVHDPSALSSGMAFEGGSIERPDSLVVDTAGGRALRETTEFTVRMLPIGGFVRIKGMVPQEDGSEVNIPGGFYNKPPWQRLIVLIGGPLFSVLAGLVILVTVYATAGTERRDLRPMIGGVIETTKTVPQPAWDAGLRAGDEIVSVDGVAIKSFYQFVKIVNASADVNLALTYRRAGKLVGTTLRPTLGLSGVYNENLEATDSKVQGRIGVEPAVTHKVLSPREAFFEAIKLPALAVTSILRLAEKPSRLKDEAGGAVTMVRVTAEATREGPAKTIEWAGALSIMVGIFNLLPIPPLDGGQMLMAFAELLRRGRRLSMRVQHTLVSAGMVAVLTLFVVVMFIDVQRITETKGTTINREPPGKQQTSHASGPAH